MILMTHTKMLIMFVNLLWLTRHHTVQLFHPDPTYDINSLFGGHFWIFTFGSSFLNNL